jgi:hypothetical protein
MAKREQTAPQDGQPDTLPDARAEDAPATFWLSLEGGGLHLERAITQAQALKVLATVLTKDTP